MIETITLIIVGAVSFFAGVIVFLMYILYRMIRNDEWDDNNITNALRILSHVTLHPTDFGKMYYLSSQQLDILWEQTGSLNVRQPFWYVNKNELRMWSIPDLSKTTQFIPQYTPLIWGRTGTSG